MPASYPTALKSFTTKVDVTDTNFAAHVNDLQNEVVALETYLGTDPHISAALSTTYATVDARLEYIETNFSTTAHTHDHGTLTGLGDDDHPQYLKESEYTAKGVVLVASGAGTPVAVTVGANGTIFEAASGQASGVQWGSAPIKVSVGTTAGDILYFNGTSWVRLGVGSPLQFLRQNAGQTAPEWATITIPDTSGESDQIVLGVQVFS